ncbi:MAG: DUF3987 domain-containing protein [Alphaproteobacteria bacterium]|nr:DUF3987 domain-containing protein [Alphaproteobacteria bacterium]
MTASAACAMPPPGADEKEILAFLTWLHGQAMRGAVEVAWKNRQGALAKAELFLPENLDLAAAKAAEVNIVEGADVYVGAALRKCGTFPHGRTSDADFLEAWALHADFDLPGAVEVALERCRQLGIEPSAIVTTGRIPHHRAQFWWRLDEPIADPAIYSDALKALATALGGDPTVTNPGRVMRLPGTIAWPWKEGRERELSEFAAGSGGMYPLEKFARISTLAEPLPGALSEPRAESATASNEPRARAPHEDGIVRATTGLGLDGAVIDGREGYMRDTVLAVALELTGALERWPTASEIDEAGWLQYAAHVDLSRPGRSREEFRRKAVYLADRLARGAVKGVPSVAEAVERYRQRHAGAGTKPERPRPLLRELPPADPFPVDALGDVLEAAARGIHDRVQAPMAICGQAVLAAVTLAVQGHADIVLPTGHARPLSGFFLTVAATGERKTACDGEALWPIRTREKSLSADYQIARERHANAREAWEKQRAQVLADKKKFPDKEAKVRALDNLGPAPVAPLLPMLLCPEPTFEGLCRLLAEGHPSAGIFSAEGGQFVGGYGMSPDNKLKTAAAMSGLWDGEPIRRVRAGDGVSMLPGRRVALHLMAQPDVAAAILSDPLLLDQGLLSRVLATAPEPAAGTRLWRDPKPASDAALKRYGARMLSILEAAPPLVEGRPNELAPRAMPMSAVARAAWIAYADHVEGMIGPAGPLHRIRGLANKLPEHAARLAAVLALVDDLCVFELSGPHMAAGIRLAEHYAVEALRLFEGGRADGELLLAARLLDWVQTEWPEPLISLPDIYQRGPNAIRDGKTARRLMGVLVEHGWVAPVPGGGVVCGVWRREAWRVVRAP